MTRIQAKTKGVVPCKTTPNNTQQRKSYQKCVLRSSENLKEKIGALLLALQTPLNQEQQIEYWAQLESMLRRYIEPKFCDVNL